MTFDDEVARLGISISGEVPGVEKTLPIEPEFEARAAELKDALEVWLRAHNESVRIEMNGPRGLRVFT